MRTPRAEQKRQIKNVYRAIFALLFLYLLVTGMTLHPELPDRQPGVGFGFKYLEPKLKEFRRKTGRLPTTQEGVDILVETDGVGIAPVALFLPRDPWNQLYIYKQLAPNKFILISKGPDQIEGTKDDLSDCVILQDSPNGETDTQ